MTKTAFRNEVFDLIILLSVLEHVGFGVYGDPSYENGDMLVIQETKRVLKADGVALITMPYAPTETTTWFRFTTSERLDKIRGCLAFESEEYYHRTKKKKWRRVRKEYVDSLLENENAYDGLGPTSIVCIKARKDK
jgi:SAM-dependent methyltransferase